MSDTTESTPGTRGGYRAGAGRPKGSTNKKAASSWTIQVRVDEALEMRIKEEAAALGVTPAAYCRRILEECIFGGR